MEIHQIEIIVGYVCPVCDNFDNWDLKTNTTCMSINCSNCGYHHNKVKIMDRSEHRENSINLILE